MDEASSDSLPDFKIQYTALADKYAEKRKLETNTWTALKDLSVLDRFERQDCLYTAKLTAPLKITVDKWLSEGHEQTWITQFNLGTKRWAELRLTTPTAPSFGQ